MEVKETTIAICFMAVEVGTILIYPLSVLEYSPVGLKAVPAVFLLDKKVKV